MTVTKVKKREVWDWEKAWRDYKRMIYKIAYESHRKYGKSTNVTFDELVSEAWNAVITKSERYDSKISCRSTWVYFTAFYGIKNYCVNRLRRHEYKNINISECSEEYSAPRGWLDNLFDEISEEAQTLIGVLLEAPEELSNVVSPTTPRRTERAVRSYMIDAMDWTRKEYRRTHKEIERHLT